MKHDPPAPLVLFALDKDYFPIIEELESYGYIVIVAYEDVTWKETQESFSTVVSWEYLAVEAFFKWGQSSSRL